MTIKKRIKFFTFDFLFPFLTSEAIHQEKQIFSIHQMSDANDSSNEVVHLSYLSSCFNLSISASFRAVITGDKSPFKIFGIVFQLC